MSTQPGPRGTMVSITDDKGNILASGYLLNLDLTINYTILPKLYKMETVHHAEIIRGRGHYLSLRRSNTYKYQKRTEFVR
jgi:hypothetical protein